jgi:hypothetical protein
MWRDLKSVLRTLITQPLVATVVVGTVALGIGGSVAVFSVVNAVLIRELPYADPGRLYVMRAVAPDGRLGNISHREFTPIYQNDKHASSRERLSCGARIRRSWAPTRDPI